MSSTLARLTDRIAAFFVDAGYDKAYADRQMRIYSSYIEARANMRDTCVPPLSPRNQRLTRAIGDYREAVDTYSDARRRYLDMKIGDDAFTAAERRMRIADAAITLALSQDAPATRGYLWQPLTKDQNHDHE